MMTVYFIRPYYLEVNGVGHIVTPGQYLDVDDAQALELQTLGYAFLDQGQTMRPIPKAVLRTAPASLAVDLTALKAFLESTDLATMRFDCYYQSCNSSPRRVHGSKVHTTKLGHIFRRLWDCAR